jgi:hypothetical protein
MALSDQLREKSSPILDRWLRDAMAAYSDDASAAFKRNKDPFTNPVGHALREGTRSAVEALVEGKDAGQVCSCLDEVIKIRAVQEFTPSQALSFVFLLKKAIRSEVEMDGGPSFSRDLVQLEEKIDCVALSAYDAFLGYRERVYQLRINEMKRSVGDWLDRMNRRNTPSRTEVVPLETSERSESQRGEGQ